MKNPSSFIVFISLFLIAAIGLGQTVRQPSVAGQLYPGDSLQLYQMIDEILENAKPQKIDGIPLALICPHAGIVYTGPTAGEAFKLLGEYPNIKTVIIIGFKHRIDYKGVAIQTEGWWKTPLGKIAINAELASKILKAADYMSTDPALFQGEHSLEVQIPFLQVIRNDLKIVPLQIGYQDRDVIDKLIKTLSDVLKNEKDFIMIASTDMSHYKNRPECRQIDAHTAAYIKKLDGYALWAAAEKDEAQLCGAAPVAVALEVAKKLGANQIKILRQSDSGDFTGDTTQVVGYLSAVIYKSGTRPKAAVEQPAKSGYLSEEEHKTLLKIARQSIEAYLDNKLIPNFEIPAGKLTENGAAFVTINRNQQLRGCIGYTEAIMPLYQTVATCAVKAASEDPRFPQLAKSEYPDIKLEISVLTPLEKITDINRIKVGTHGLMLQKGYYRGLLLPQVATSYGWNRDEFLDQTCRKAGMPAGCWKDGCDIYIFSAEVFGEE